VEGAAEENPMMSRGYSRDHRPDCEQMVIALIVNREGFPFSYETFDGNRTDVSTMESILRMVERKYGKARRSPSRPTRVSDPGTGAASALPKTPDHTGLRQEIEVPLRRSARRLAAARSTPTDRHPELNRRFHLMLTTPRLGETSSLQILGELAMVA